MKNHLRNSTFALGVLFGLVSCELQTATPPQGRNGDQLTWANRSWTVKGGPDLFGPGPNYFSKDLESAYTDDQGYLHLNIRQIDSKWQCSEIISNDVVGYGTYTWEVQSNMVDIPDNTVLGLFTWDNNTFYAQANSEVDIEFSRWGDPNKAKTMATSVQPVWFGGFNAERTHEFSLPPEAKTMWTTHEFKWTDSLITWTSYLGAKASSNLIASWSFDDNNPARQKGEGGVLSNAIVIPAPGPTTNARLNLWLFGGQNSGPSTGSAYEVVIRNFTYQPL
ncbi:MAG: glycoside hydrolase family 16 protein [Schleiferiaceae bacterium]|nr:glycoside hydrolase family 16 protein [Schleiferiaceae bacterium]